MKSRFQIALFLLTFVPASACLWADGPILAEPKLPAGKIVVPEFGDDENVMLLARLLHDADPRVREEAAMGLGETHNPAAMRHLEDALRDKNPAVRCAVVSASAEYPGNPAAERVVISALGETEPILLQAALRSTARLNLKIASERIEELLPNRDPQVRMGALEALTFFGKPVDNKLLPKLLAYPSVPVQMQAIRNATLQPRPAGITRALKKLTEATSPPAIRAGAIEALGKLAMESSEKLIARAAGSDNPLLRRAAVRAYSNAGRIESVEPLLDDRSGMVRLAAIRAAGQLKSKRVETLTSLMLSAPDMQSHLAARLALVRIGTDDVASLAAYALRHEMKKYLKQTADNKVKIKGPSPAHRRLEENLSRNVCSCCFILGQLRSKQGFNYMLSLRNMVEIDSPIIGAMARALGKIGDSRAVGPLTEILKKCRDRGYKYIVALTSMSPPPSYSPEITSDIIEALGELRAYPAVKIICGIVSTNYMQMRLPAPAVGAARAFQKLIQPGNRKKSKKSIIEILNDKAFGLTARSYAAKAAVTLNIKSALPALRTILSEERPCLLVMQTAAWAIQELTGQTPAIPQPKTRQGNWIIQKANR